MTAPPAEVLRPESVMGLIVFLRSLTLPSHLPTLTPPE
jgi:hypothetical protein